MYAYAECISKYFGFVQPFSDMSRYLRFLIFKKNLHFSWGGGFPRVFPICLKIVFKKVVQISCAIALVYTLQVPLLAENQTSSEWEWLYE